MMDSGPLCARLCHIVKWEHFDGYGFNLHAEKGKTGQFIGKVDEGSPSEAAGLRQGDRIVEVNEINIANESHKQVVERIKAFPTETKLLVVDQAADDYFKANNIPIKGTMHGVRYMKTPERHFDDDPEDEGDEVDHSARQDRGTVAAAAAGPLPVNSKSTVNGSQGTTSDSHSIASSSGDNHSTSNNSHGKENGSNGMTTTTTTTTTTSNNSMGHEDEDNVSNKSSSSSSNNKDATQAAISANGSTGSLNLLQMSAKELRAKLAQRKKYDPKKESMGFKDKFDIVQKL